MTFLMVSLSKGFASGRLNRKYFGNLRLRKVDVTQMNVETTHWNHVTKRVALSLTLVPLKSSLLTNTVVIEIILKYYVDYYDPYKEFQKNSPISGNDQENSEIFLEKAFFGCIEKRIHDE